MLDDDYNKPNIIIDNGSGFIKSGLSGEEGPRAVFPTIVGYPKYSSGMIGKDKKDVYIGQEAEYKRGVLKINHPIEHGFINYRDDMEKIWNHIFTNELRVAPEEHNILLTECSNDPRLNREIIAQRMFESYFVQGLYISNPGVLSLYSYGKFTGIVVDLGHGVSQIVPVFDGVALSHALCDII